MEEIIVDLLVVGSGGAGLRAAITARQTGVEVAVACLGSGASPSILAFNVPLGCANSNDNPEVYYQDIMEAGRFINNPNLVQTLAKNSLHLITEFEEYGLRLEKDNEGRFIQRHLGGSRFPRSVYISDHTGQEALNCMQNYLKNLGYINLSGVRIVTLVLLEGKVVGAIGIQSQTNVMFFIQAKSVVLASGGIGQIYHDSTYPLDVVGDSYGLALRAGAQLVDMEFVQFEPTVCFSPASLRGMEMPTAMFGDGAVLRNNLGERFILDKNSPFGEPGLEKAVMAKYIYEEIQSGKGSSNGGVYFDTTGISLDTLKGYPKHLVRLRDAGIDPVRQYVEVKPASHSQMGGIKINSNCWTGIPGLFAAGEAAGGVHGASRIAGNSGSDVFVFGAIAGKNAAEFALKTDCIPDKSDLKWTAENALASLHSQANYLYSGDIDLLQKIREIMSESAGLVRESSGLQEALNWINRRRSNNEKIVEDVNFWADIVHTVYVGQSILLASLLREESRGAHYRSDFPEERKEWRKNIYLSLDKHGELEYMIEPTI